MSSPTVTPPSGLVDVAYSLLEHNSSGWLREPLVDSLKDFLATLHHVLNLSDSPNVEKRAPVRWFAIRATRKRGLAGLMVETTD